MKNKKWLLSFPIMFFCGCMINMPYAKMSDMKDLSATNYDEKKVPPYSLPPLLIDTEGVEITSATDWQNRRRPEILHEFEELMYGKIPPAPDNFDCRILNQKDNALNNSAIRKELEVTFKMNNGKSHKVLILLYLPKNSVGKVPLFVGLTFGGNQVVTFETDVIKSGAKGKFNEKIHYRASQAHRWRLEDLMTRQYAVAIASYHDFFPDRPDGYDESIYQLFDSTGEKYPGSSAISGWAWGLSRMLDVLETESRIDAEKVAVIGHSRLGKAALWAGVNDERFKLVCVNNSGCGGAALSRRVFGETLYSMYTVNPVGEWWFRAELKDKVLDVNKFKIDQHMLLALVFPRFLSVHSASEDLWADPRGEYLALCSASELNKFTGQATLPTNPVAIDSSIDGRFSYFLRAGKHDLIWQDWQHYLKQADFIFKQNEGK